MYIIFSLYRFRVVIIITVIVVVAVIYSILETNVTAQQILIQKWQKLFRKNLYNHKKSFIICRSQDVSKYVLVQLVTAIYIHKCWMLWRNGVGIFRKSCTVIRHQQRTLFFSFFSLSFFSLRFSWRVSVRFFFFSSSFWCVYFFVPSSLSILSLQKVLRFGSSQGK